MSIIHFLTLFERTDRRQPALEYIGRVQSRLLRTLARLADERRRPDLGSLGPMQALSLSVFNDVHPYQRVFLIMCTSLIAHHLMVHHLMVRYI